MKVQEVIMRAMAKQITWWQAPDLSFQMVLTQKGKNLTGTLDSPHKHAIFLVGLVLLAFMTSYQVYRVRALSRFYEHRRLP